MKTALLSAVFALAPAIAEACPACAGRDRGGVTTLLLLGSMIVLPFAVARIAAKAIRAEEQLEKE
jgi:hypothetical protein